MMKRIQTQRIHGTPLAGVPPHPHCYSTAFIPGGRPAKGLPDTQKHA